jgi:hypothetical protein
MEQHTFLYDDTSVCFHSTLYCGSKLEWFDHFKDMSLDLTLSKKRWRTETNEPESIFSQHLWMSDCGTACISRLKVLIRS